MQHRHLNHDELTLAGIDSIIERGDIEDWLRLAHACQDDTAIADTVRQVVTARLENPHADEEFFARPYFEVWQKSLPTFLSARPIDILAENLRIEVFAKGMPSKPEKGDWRECLDTATGKRTWTLTALVEQLSDAQMRQRNIEPSKRKMP